MVEAIGMAAIFLLAWLLRNQDEFQGEPMASEFVAAGALVGSLIATWFRKSARWAFQAFTGFWVGFVSAHWLVDYMGWPQTENYLLMSGSIMGVIGCKLIETVLSAAL